MNVRNVCRVVGGVLTGIGIASLYLINKDVDYSYINDMMQRFDASNYDSETIFYMVRTAFDITKNLFFGGITLWGANDMIRGTFGYVPARTLQAMKSDYDILSTLKGGVSKN